MGNIDAEEGGSTEEPKINGGIVQQENKLRYGITDRPPWHLSIFFALQLVLATIGSCIAVSFIISSTICADAAFTAKIFSTTCVMAGVTTVLQVFLGVRLPVFQGPTPLGLLPYLYAQTDPAWRCDQNMTELYLSLTRNGTATSINPDENGWDEQWSRIQGAMMVGAAFEACLGLTGLVGLMSKFVRPVSMTVIFVLLGVYLWGIAASLGEAHWGIAFGSTFFVVMFALYLHKFNIPVPSWSRNGGCGLAYFPFFQLFPILLTIMVMWPVCYVITIAGGFSDDPTAKEYKVRTDIHFDDIRNAPAFTFPYPGQFGKVGFDMKYAIFYLPVFLASSVESLADYYQYAVACQVPLPPPHAINRGIAMEGIGAMFSALLGAGHPTTSYSSMMGIITLTKVCSRHVMVIAGLILATVGGIGPLAATLVAIPKPVLFGPMMMSIAMLTGSAFTNLLTVDVTKRRNLSILGISIYLACVVSFFVTNNPDVINTDSQLFNDVATGILKIHFLVGGCFAVFLDMTLPDDTTKTDRPADVDGDANRVYDPPFIGPFLRRYRIFKYIPFLPGPSAT